MNIEKELMKLAIKAYKKNEIPVGAVIVKDNKIIGKGYNKRQRSGNVLDHAEVIAIKNASKKLKDWRLDGCELHSTMEPCEMCKKVIETSRISNVYYYLNQNKKTTGKTLYKKIDSDMNKKYKNILKISFDELRNK